MATTPLLTPVPTAAPTPRPTQAPTGLVSTARPTGAYGTVSTDPMQSWDGPMTGGEYSVWAGAPLQDRQVAEAKDYISKNLGGGSAFDANGRYITGDTARDAKLVGWQQAMGVSDADMARITGYTADEVANYRKTLPSSGVNNSDQEFHLDNPNLFVKNPAPTIAPTPGPTPTPSPSPTPLPRLTDTPYGGELARVPPQLDRTVDFQRETIEGRLNNVLKRDSRGNYLNEVVRQAVERAQQQFARRGLVNTSMAAQAGQEAAIAKAIEIVGPDAERYFQTGRANQDARNVFSRDETQQAYTERNNLAQWSQDRTMQNDRINADAGMQNQRIQNEQFLAEMDRNFRERQLSNEQAFNLRQNYITAQDRVSQSYQRMVDTINSSQMEPEAKTAAIANAAQIRDSEAAYINSIFSRQPQWSNDWLAMSVQVGGANVSTLTDVNALATIANDPAQPQLVRQQAQARLAELEANPPMPSSTPAPGGLVDFNGSGA